MNSRLGRRKDAVAHRYQEILETSGAYRRYREILNKTKNEANFLKAFEMGEDRASGKALQRNENTNIEDNDRPSTEALVETIRTLREELKSLREGVGVEAKE